MPPTAEAFAARDWFTEEVVKVGVFIGFREHHDPHRPRASDAQPARGDFLFRAGRLAEVRSEFKAAATLTRNARSRSYAVSKLRRGSGSKTDAGRCFNQIRVPNELTETMNFQFYAADGTPVYPQHFTGTLQKVRVGDRHGADE